VRRIYADFAVNVGQPQREVRCFPPSKTFTIKGQNVGYRHFVLARFWQSNRRIMGRNAFSRSDNPESEKMTFAELTAIGARNIGGTFMTKNIKAEGPNRDSIDYWNGPQGQNLGRSKPLVRSP